MKNKLLLSTALMTIFALNANASLPTVEADLLNTTLSELNAAGTSPIPSGYKLEDNTTGAINITKYWNDSGVITPETLSVVIDPLGASTGAAMPLYFEWTTDANNNQILAPTTNAANADITYNMPTIGEATGTRTLYYKWDVDATTGNRVLSSVDLVVDPTASYDFEASTNRTARYYLNGSFNTNIITDSFVNLGSTGVFLFNAGIGGIEADFIGNSGKGIFIDGAAGTGKIGYIIGDFIGNYSTGIYGGAISNVGTIGDITGNFIGNYTNRSAGNYTSGGAIGNRNTIGNITGDFIGNYVYNTSTSLSYPTIGGAISAFDGVFGSVSGNFVNNYIDSISSAYGGAIGLFTNISNTLSEIPTITGSFIGNYAKSSGSVAYGGAIASSFVSTPNARGNINTIYGDFIGNYAQGQLGSRGGAISLYSNASSSTIGDIYGDFIENYAYSPAGASFGGAIYSYNPLSSIGSITGDFIKNYAKSDTYEAKGGAIYNYLASITSISGDFIENYVDSAHTTDGLLGGAIYNNSTIGSISGSFINNYAISPTDVYGGAIVNLGTIGTANGSGGYSSGISAYFYQNGQKSDGSNQAQYGGAIYNSAQTDDSTKSATIAILGSTFEENIATIHGGAIYNTNLFDTDNRNSSTNLIIQSAGSTRTSFIGNEAQFGGAIYNDSSKGTITIDADFSGNKVSTGTTSSKGGAIYNSTDGVITSIAGNFTSNYAYGSTIGSNSGDMGGAIYNDGTISSLSAAFTTNGLNTDFGGAIYNTGTITDIGSSTFISNNIDKGGQGGAIFNSGSITSTTGATFTSNKIVGTSGSNTTSSQGGAVYNASGATFTMTNGSFANNIIDNTSGYGGAFYNAGTASFDGTTFSGNTAELASQGGAIYNSSTITLSDVIFSGNNAGNGSQGGALYNASTGTTGDISVTFDGNYIAATNSSSSGAGLYNAGTIGNITGLFEDNYITTTTGAAYGAGIFNSSTVGNVTANFNNNYITSTSTSSPYGGAIYNTGDMGNIIGNFDNNTLTSASASAFGGAIYNTGDILDITGDFTDNKVTASTSGNAFGGAIYNSGSLDNINGDFEGNSATSSTGTGSGGAIYNSSTITSITSESFTGNTASDNGGAIYNTATGQMTILDTSFTNNSTSAGGLGGAIYNIGTINIQAINKDITFSGNTVGTTDNAIHNLGTIRMNAGSHIITFDDAITGSGNINISNGSVVFNQNVANNVTLTGNTQLTLGVLNTTKINNHQTGVTVGSLNSTSADVQINTLDNEVTDYFFTDMNIANSTFMIDMSLSDETSDRFNITGNANIDTSLMLINIVDAPTAAITSGRIEVFNAGSGASITLPDAKVNLVSYSEQIDLIHDLADPGWYEFTLDITKSFNLNTAISELDDSRITQYSMIKTANGGLGDESITSRSVGTEITEATDPDVGSFVGKVMNVDGTDGTGGFTVSSGESGGADALLTLIDGSEYNSFNVNYDNVNFNMTATGNKITFNMLEDVTSLTLDSDFTSNDQTNEVNLNGNGSLVSNYTVTGNINNLTLNVNANANISSSAITSAIINANGSLTGNASITDSTLNVNSLYNGTGNITNSTITAIKDSIFSSTGVITGSTLNATEARIIIGGSFVGDGTIDDSTLRINSGASFTSNGTITDTDLVANGATLIDVNNFTGSSAVQNSTIKLDAGSVFTTTGTIANSTLNATGADISLENYSGDGTIASSTVDISGIFNSSGNISNSTITAVKDSTFASSGTVTNTTLNATEAGVLIQGTFSGNGTITDSTLQVDNSASFTSNGTITDTHLIANGATLIDVNNFTGSSAVQNSTIKLDAGSVFTTTGTIANTTLNATNATIGLENYSGDGTITGSTINVATNGVFASSGTITNTELNADNAGVLITGTFEGDGTITDSTLQIDNGGSYTSTGAITGTSLNANGAALIDVDNFTGSSAVQNSTIKLDAGSVFTTTGTITNTALNATNADISLENYSGGGAITGSTIDVITNGLFASSGTITDTDIVVDGSVQRSGYDEGVTYTLNADSTLSYNNFGNLYDGNQATLNSITFNGGTLTGLNNGVTDTIVLQDLNVYEDVTLGLEVDLAKEEMDNINASNVTITTGKEIDVSQLYLISDATKEGTTTTNFTKNPNLAASVVYSGDAQVSYGPVYLYDVTYDALTGNFNFFRNGDENPQVQAPAIGALATAIINDEIYLKVLADSSFELEAKGIPSGDYFDRGLKNFWTKAFGSDETLDIKNAPSVDANFSGMIAGLDTNLIYEGSCVYSQYGIYAAYTNGYMEFDGNKFYQDGYFAGAKANFYIDNWFIGTTASIGTMSSKDKNVSSSKFDTYLAGLGIKAGYNHNLGNGYELIPSIFASYVYTTSDDYTSAMGAEVDFGDSHNFIISPELKLSKEINETYQAYTKASYIHSFNSGQNVVVDGFGLQNVLLKPYVEYGIGFEKLLGNWTGFAEIIRKDLGSEGFEALIGLKYHW